MVDPSRLAWFVQVTGVGIGKKKFRGPTLAPPDVVKPHGPLGTPSESPPRKIPAPTAGSVIGAPEGGVSVNDGPASRKVAGAGPGGPATAGTNPEKQLLFDDSAMLAESATNWASVNPVTRI